MKEEIYTTAQKYKYAFNPVQRKRAAYYAAEYGGLLLYAIRVYIIHPSVHSIAMMMVAQLACCECVCVYI